MSAVATARITVERRANDYIAFLDGDHAKWEAAPSAVEAIGKLVMSHARALGVSVAVLNQTRSETLPGGLERPDQAYIDYASDRALEEAAEADFCGDTYSDFDGGEL